MQFRLPAANLLAKRKNTGVIIMNTTVKATPAIDINQREQLIDYLNQSRALAEVGMSLHYTDLNKNMLFHYFSTLNCLLLKAIQVIEKLS